MGHGGEGRGNRWLPPAPLPLFHCPPPATCHLLPFQMSAFKVRSLSSIKSTLFFPQDVKKAAKTYQQRLAAYWGSARRVVLAGHSWKAKSPFCGGHLTLSRLVGSRETLLTMPDTDETRFHYAPPQHHTMTLWTSFTSSFILLSVVFFPNADVRLSNSMPFLPTFGRDLEDNYDAIGVFNPQVLSHLY